MSDQISPFVGKGSNKSLSFTQQIIVTTTAALTTRDWSPWGKNHEVSKLLRQAESGQTLNGFRRSQLIFAGYSVVSSLGWMLLRLSSGKNLTPLIAVTIMIGTFICGGWFAKWRIARKANQRRATVEEQLPAALDLLAFAVSAGEPIFMALKRISNSCAGPLISEFTKVVNDVNSGDGLVPALNQMSNDLDSQPVARATRSLELALERGTPLAQVLRAQAADARAHQIRMLLVLAGHKETSMMVPVVFLILPMIVAVALYPGMVALQVL